MAHTSPVLYNFTAARSPSDAGLEPDWWQKTGVLEPSFSILEERLAPDVIEAYDLTIPVIPDALRDWFQAVTARLSTSPALTNVPLNPELAPRLGKRPTAPVEIMLCSRQTMDVFLDQEGALGIHLVTAPEGDPFAEDSATSKVYRAIMVYDEQELLDFICKEAPEDQDPFAYLSSYVEAWLNTLFHEIEHVRLFAQNAAMHSPHLVETMHEAGDFGPDLYDCITGYGLRPLLNSYTGKPVWAQDMDEAHEYMEDHVEEAGKRLMHDVLQDSVTALTFLDAAGLTARVDAILAEHETPVS